MNRNFIFSTIINPPLVFGVTPPFAFLILFLLFLPAVAIRALGIFGFLIIISAVIYFYFYGRKKTAKDPYWMNVVIMAFLFERKRPLEFLKRFFTKKDKVFSK